MGSFDVIEISALSQSAELPVWFPIGIIGYNRMLFKVAAVPFHFWAPDVYEGSPALTTALMSTLAKVVAIATLYKLLSVMNADVSESFKMVVVIISMLMSVGNMALTNECETYVGIFRYFSLVLC
jgi:NADH-quinone oxidoreductase subunit N